jgi:hypothetical protein
MTWEIMFTNQFEQTWRTLTAIEQRAITDRVELLQSEGPNLGRPYADRVRSSRFQNMKELIVPEGSSEFRVLYAFDPARRALLLILGDKSPNDPSTPNWNAWYDRMVPIADQIFEAHLNTLQ